MAEFYDAEGDERIERFQELVNSGQAWLLEGAVGREATALIEGGYITLGDDGHQDYWGNYVPSKTEVQSGTKGSEAFVKARTAEREAN